MFEKDNTLIIIPIGVSRLVAAAIEQNNDDKGIVWPHEIAPFDINIIAIGYEKDQKISEAADSLYAELIIMGIIFRHISRSGSLNC